MPPTQPPKAARHSVPAAKMEIVRPVRIAPLSGTAKKPVLPLGWFSLVPRSGGILTYINDRDTVGNIGVSPDTGFTTLCKGLERNARDGV